MDVRERVKGILETIPNEFPGRSYVVELESAEVTSMCPFTEIPDFYRVKIVYVPDEKLVELKSLKLYLQAFRNLRVIHETLLNIIFEDLKDLLSPKYLMVELKVNIRGGIETVVRREEGERPD